MSTAAQIVEDLVPDCATIASMDAFGRMAIVRRNRQESYEREVKRDPGAWRNWQWRRFGVEDFFTPAPGPIDWLNHDYDYLRKP